MKITAAFAPPALLPSAPVPLLRGAGHLGMPRRGLGMGGSYLCTTQRRSFAPTALLLGGGGPVDVETLKQMEPRSNMGETVIFIAMMASFAYIRVKFDRAIAARQDRVNKEEELRQAKAASVAGDTSVDVLELEADVKKLREKEKAEKEFIPGTGLDVRIPPLPRDPEDISRQRVAQSRRGGAPPPPLQPEEERIPAWQEALLVGGMMVMLLPLLFFTLADPMQPPTPGGAVDSAMQQGLGGNAPAPASRR